MPGMYLVLQERAANERNRAAVSSLSTRFNESVVTSAVKFNDLDCNLSAVDQKATQVARDLPMKVALLKQDISTDIDKLSADAEALKRLNLPAQLQVHQVSVEQKIQSVRALAVNNPDVTVSRVKAEQALQGNVSLGMSVKQQIEALKRQFDTANLRACAASAYNQSLGLAFNGNMLLLLDSAAEDVSAALLNAATAGTFIKTFSASLVANEAPEGQNPSYTGHRWAGFEPVITPAEAVDDSDVGVPVITWADDVTADPKFAGGELHLIVTFDTGAGKTYAIDDEVTVEIQVASDNKLLGYTVAAVTKTYTVIA